MDDDGLELEGDQPKLELDRKADDITARGIELLRSKVAANERFFLFLHYFDPHWPHEAPERFTTQYPDDGYLAEIAFFDEQFGKLIDAVRELGLRRNTLVILTADHGEGRGEHGEETHSVFLYDSTLHVPLVVWCPEKIPAGQVVDSQVRLIDLAPTIVDFVGLERTAQMQGESLLPLAGRSPAGHPAPCYSDSLVAKHNLNYSALRSLRVDGWKYVLAPRPELYNLTEDPQELFNLAEIDADRADRMKNELRAIIADSPSAVRGNSVVETQDPLETRKLAALGYLSTAPSESATGDELDSFEPIGVNPRDRIEIVECWARGLGAFRTGNFELAAQCYRRYVELEPQNATAMSYLAQALMMLSRDDEATEIFRRATILDPDNFHQWRMLGNLLASNRKHEDAIECYQRVISLNRDEVVGRLNLGVVLTARQAMGGSHQGV